MLLLRQAREATGWTQRELGRRMAKHHTYVNLIESGERQLNIIELLEVLKALGEDGTAFVARLETALAELELQTPVELTD